MGFDQHAQGDPVCFEARLIRGNTRGAQLGAVKIELWRGFNFAVLRLPSTLSPAPVDNSIPVKMSPSNTPAAMAATSQDIEMLLAAQVRATAHYADFFD